MSHVEHWLLGFASLLNQVIHKVDVPPAPSSQRPVQSKRNGCPPSPWPPSRPGITSSSHCAICLSKTTAGSEHQPIHPINSLLIPQGLMKRRGHGRELAILRLALLCGKLTGLWHYLLTRHDPTAHRSPLV